MNSIVRVERSDELTHHGVKYMHWGEWNAETAARYNRKYGKAYGKKKFHRDQALMKGAHGAANLSIAGGGAAVLASSLGTLIGSPLGATTYAATGGALTSVAVAPLLTSPIASVTAAAAIGGGLIAAAFANQARKSFGKTGKEIKAYGKEKKKRSSR